MLGWASLVAVAPDTSTISGALALCRLMSAPVLPCSSPVGAVMPVVLRLGCDGLGRGQSVESPSSLPMSRKKDLVGASLSAKGEIVQGRICAVARPRSCLQGQSDRSFSERCRVAGLLADVCSSARLCVARSSVPRSFNDRWRVVGLLSDVHTGAWVVRRRQERYSP